MASAFKKKLRRPADGNQYQAQDMLDEAEAVGAMEDGAGAEGDGVGADGLHEIALSPENGEGVPPSPRGGQGAGRRRSSSALGSKKITRKGGTGPGADAAGPSRKRPVEPPVQWDAKAFKDCRPLKCESIWDVPTSRIPEPLPEPKVERRRREPPLKKKASKLKRTLPIVAISGPAEAGQAAREAEVRLRAWRVCRVALCAGLVLAGAIGVAIVAL